MKLSLLYSPSSSAATTKRRTTCGSCKTVILPALRISSPRSSYHGGWLAPNIYFLGHAGCVQVNGVRIAGASGIFKRRSFTQGTRSPHFSSLLTFLDRIVGHFERFPYDKSAVRSIYHLREYNIRRLALVSPNHTTSCLFRGTDQPIRLKLSQPRIFLSHDWPKGIVYHGDLDALLQEKPHFEEDIETGRFGAPPLMDLLRILKPELWFAAHMHVRFEATVVHSLERTPIEAGNTAPWANPDDIVVGRIGQPPERLEEPWREYYEVEAEVVPPPPSGSQTRFIALDKCLHDREFIEVCDSVIHISYNES